MSDDHAGDPPPDLDHLRTLIDDLDQRLVELLNERARVVVDVGRAKHGDGTPIYAPDRESAVLGRVLAANAGPLPERTLGLSTVASATPTSYSVR